MTAAEIVAKDANRYRKMTQAELVALATELFGEDRLTWAFRCPSCGDVASLRDFIEVGAPPTQSGKECIGRYLGALAGKPTRDGGTAKAKRGCDWSAYGQGPWEIVVPADGDTPERSMWGFPLAGTVCPRCGDKADTGSDCEHPFHDIWA